MKEFTNLERAVLNAICDAHPEMTDTLRELLATARLSDRDNTGHGFYTSFRVESVGPRPAFQFQRIDGPNAEVLVGDKTLLMGFILWLEGGGPSCLEGFQHGTPEGGNIDLKEINLERLGLLSLLS